MVKKSELRKILLYTKEQAKKAHAELDVKIASIPKACGGAGCDACCYQMVAVHTWEEELIGSYIQTAMHADTKAIVRKQMLDWWRYLKSILRPATRDNPITPHEYQNLQQHMINARVMCPFLVDRKCSIYPVRPAICRAYVVPDDPDRCKTEFGRLGDMQAAMFFMDIFGAESSLLPRDRYIHSMKPLAFAMTGVFRLPVPSTPVVGLVLGDVMPMPQR